MLDMSSTEAAPSFNGGVVYPLLIATGILAYTVYERREALHAHYVALGSGRVARDAFAVTSVLVLAGLAANSREESPSSILSVGAGMTLVGALGLAFPRAERGAAAASGASPVLLLLLCLSLALRLTVTSRVSAYLPDDKTGDWLYQLTELCTLLVALREYVLWQDRPHSLFTPSLSFYGGALLAVLAAALASQCYGDLASRPLLDQAYAASVYVELGAWLFQAVAMHYMTRDQINLRFLLPAAAGVACRTLFWDLAASEVMPTSPVKLQHYFPTALVGMHLAMAGLAAGSCLLGVLKRVRTPAPPQPAAPVEQVPEPAYAPEPSRLPAHVQHYAKQARHPYLEPEPAGGVHAAEPAGAIEFREALPAGCTQFMPVSSVYENGELVVKFRPM